MLHHCHLLFGICMIWLAPLKMGAQASSPACLSVLELSQQPIDSLDRQSLTTCRPQRLILLLGAAQQLRQDTAFDQQLRGDICYSLVADELQRRSEQKDFDPEAPAIAFLIEELEAQQYFLALNRPSDWEKLGHYLAEGEYGYVAKRFVDRGGLTYLLVSLSIGLLGWMLFRRYRKNKTQVL